LEWDSITVSSSIRVIAALKQSIYQWEWKHK